VDRLYTYALTIAVLGAVLEPILHAEPKDGFPLSTYPMFSSRRGVETTLSYAAALGKGKLPRPLPPRFTGSDEVLQARATIQQAVDRGPRGAKELCGAIAARVAADRDAFAYVEMVEIRTDTYNAVAYFEGQTAPLASKLQARCRVVRP
jgi:hypothetical protein